jgi:hypothetical protein
MDRYTVTVEFSVTVDSDDYLQSPQAIEEECESWLESLRAVVDSVRVQPVDEKDVPNDGNAQDERLHGEAVGTLVVVRHRPRI